jgi:hypothetical protein
MERQLADSKDKLLVATDHISDLQHANKSLSNKTASVYRQTIPRGTVTVQALAHHISSWALLVPVVRTSGWQQDLATEGAAAVYWNRRYYVWFLDECLRGCKDNILQENLFIVLVSVEMIALCRTMAIFHFKVCMPLRWIAGNTHFLGQQGYNWSTRLWVRQSMPCTMLWLLSEMTAVYNSIGGLVSTIFLVPNLLRFKARPKW